MSGSSQLSKEQRQSLAHGLAIWQHLYVKTKNT